MVSALTGRGGGWGYVDDVRSRSATIPAGLRLGIVGGARVVLVTQSEPADLTHAERSRAESEMRLRATFEHVPVGIAQVGPDGCWLWVNRHLADILGYSQRELLALTFQDVTHSDDLDADLEQYQRTLAGELSSYRIEKRYIRKDGSPVWINLTVSLVREEGQPDYFVCVIEDISRRRQAEDEIRRLNMELERQVRESTAELERQTEALREQAELVELAPSAILVREIGSGRIRHWSRGAEQIYGWTRQEAIGCRPFELLRTEFPRPLVEIEAELIREGHWEGEVAHWRRDGTRLVVATRWALLSGGDGQPRAILTVNTDITGRKQVEQLRSEFVSLVSHELRTPLTSIKGYTDVLLSEELGALSDEQSQFLQVIQRNADRLMALVNDLLDLSRLEVGGLALHHEPLMLAPLIQAAAAMLLPQMVTKQQQFVLDIAPNLPLVSGDADRIAQVMTNLISTLTSTPSQAAPSLCGFDPSRAGCG